MKMTGLFFVIMFIFLDAQHSNLACIALETMTSNQARNQGGLSPLQKFSPPYKIFSPLETCIEHS